MAAFDSVSVGEPSPASAVSAAAPGRSAVTLAAPIVALLLIILSLTPSLGGYGLILWVLHPIGLILAVCLLLPLSFGAALGDVARLTSLDSLAKRAFPRAGARELHGAVNALAVLCAVLGFLVAWGTHEAKGHRHFPALTKSAAKILHVYVGYAALAALLAQAAAGAARLFAASPWPHAAYGRAVWLALVFVLGLGLWLMLFEKNSAVLSAAVAVSLLAVLVSAVLRGGCGGG